MNLGRGLDLGGETFVISVIGDYSHSFNYGQQYIFYSMDTIPKHFLIGREVVVCHIFVAYGSLQIVIIILRFLSNDTRFPTSISGVVYRFKFQLFTFLGIILQQYYNIQQYYVPLVAMLQYPVQYPITLYQYQFFMLWYCRLYPVF